MGCSQRLLHDCIQIRQPKRLAEELDVPGKCFAIKAGRHYVAVNVRRHHDNGGFGTYLGRPS